MARVRVKLNIGQFNALRNSPEVVGLLEEHGEQIRAAAETMNTRRTADGDAFRVTTVHNRTRAVTFVATANIDGIRAEATDRILSKALG